MGVVVKEASDVHFTATPRDEQLVGRFAGRNDNRINQCQDEIQAQGDGQQAPVTV